MQKSKSLPARRPPPQFTTTPIERDENWVRLPKIKQTLCGLTRSHLYQLCSRGLIRSISLRQPHHKRGVRLLYRPSIHEFLAKLDAEQNGAYTRYLASDRWQRKRMSALERRHVAAHLKQR